jgi:hypothetical protein
MRPIARFRARLCLEVLAERCLLSTYGLDHTVKVSQADPFAGCTADHPENQSGTFYPDTALETWLVADPTNPDHLVGLWQQDRWSNGGSRGLVGAVSFDGGQTWQQFVLPGASQCSGGTTARASDPWVAFGPDGSLYATILTVSGQGSTVGVSVSKSTDGGLSWQAPVPIPIPGGTFIDKESIAVDPFNPQNVYVVWTQSFSRSTDGGQTWSTARFLNTGSGSQIVVLPDGTLVDSDGCEVFRSTNQGLNWTGPIQYPNCQQTDFVVDPNTHQNLRAGLGLGDIAEDPNTGALYVVIEDSTFNGGQQDGIAITTSLDGGLTWSRPVQANQTPTNIPPADQQAFIPTVQVAADGTVGVTYYDFRNNQIGAGNPLVTDYWFVPGTPDGSGGITWGNELRLTHKSFNYEDAPFSVYGKMIGDYQGHASAGNDFLNLFGYPPRHHGTDVVNGDAIYFRRVVNQGGAAGAAGDLDAGAQDVAAADLGSNDPSLGAALRLDPAGASSPVVLTPDQAAGQSSPVDVPALTDLFPDTAAPAAIRLTQDGQGLAHAAPAHAVDVVMPALLSGGDIQDIQ